MPGSKRRALKKFLSPHSEPQSAQSSFSSAGPAPSNGAVTQPPPLSLPSGAPLMDEPAPLAGGSALSPQEESAVLDDMHAREGAIGHHGANGVHKSASAPAAMPMTAEQLMSATAEGNGGGKKKSSKQRFLEREARKKEQLLASAPVSDPAADAQLEREKADEERIIGQTCRDLSVAIHEVPPDGHCMYYAIADQLAGLGLMDPQEASTPREVRRVAADYLRKNADAFMPFVPSVLGEDMAGATDDGVMTPEGYAEYCRRVEESGDWGGEIEIQALARAYSIPIHVIQRGPPAIIAHTPDDGASGAMSAKESLACGKAVRISYHRRMYGLGEHYNSLRPVQ